MLLVGRNMSTKQRVVIIGGIGNGMVAAQVIADMAKAGAPIMLAGFLNDHLAKGEQLGHWPVLGAPAQWQNLDTDISFCFALLSVGKMRQRADMLKALQIPPQRLATLIHPSAVIGFDSQIEPGCIVCSHTTIQPGARIGLNTIIRAGANLGHDSQIGAYVDIGPNVSICGYAKIAEGTHVAPNAVVRDSIQVGSYSTISAGAVILRDVPTDSTWIGNPARRVM